MYNQKSRHFLLALALSFFGLNCIKANADELEAWWLRVQFPVGDQQYLGLNAAEIDPQWARYSLIDFDSLPTEAKPDIASMKSEHLAFKKEGDFNKNGLADQAFVGNFETKDDKTGRFFLIAEKQKADIWKVIFLHKEIGDAGFSVIAEKDKALYWAPCIQCSEFRKLVKQGNNLILQ